MSKRFSPSESRDPNEALEKRQYGQESRAAAGGGGGDDMGEFEDAYADDVESDDEVYEQAAADEDLSGSLDDDFEESDSSDSDEEQRVLFRPGIDQLEEGEKLDYDASAYVMLHAMNVEWPCLSFDLLPDVLGAQRSKFPLTFYAVAGTQADVAHNNRLIIMKLSSLHRTKHDDDDEGAITLDGHDSDDDDLDDDPELDFRSIIHPGGINRLRVAPRAENIVATWTDDQNGKVCLWDVAKHAAALDAPPTSKLGNSIAPVAELTRNSTEGFGLAWSPHAAGRLVSGDCSGGLFMAELRDGLSWEQGRPFVGHEDSVEDLCWSPTEETIFASCSADKTVKIWDTRMRKSCGRSFVASEVDVNVISWNAARDYLLASGHDDGSFEVWDLRSLNRSAEKPRLGENVSCASVSRFQWHTDQVTSIQWDPNDESVLAVSGGDDQVTIWDLSVEEDPDEVGQAAGTAHVDVPPQLMFVHQGQSDIKELHWHPQIPSMIMTTAADSFNTFIPDIIAGRESEKLGKEEK